MSLVGNIPANWPDSLSVFYSVASFFAFEINVVSLRCMDPNWDFKWDMVVQFILPLAIIFVLSVVALVQRTQSAKMKLIKDKEERQNSTYGDSLFPTDSNKRAKIEPSPASVTAMDARSASGVAATATKDLTVDGTDPEITGKLPGSAEKSYSNIIKALVDKSKEVGKSIYGEGSLHVDAAKFVVKEDKKYIHEFWRRVFNILEITYLVSTLYSLTALRGVMLDGETVVFRYPVRIFCTRLSFPSKILKHFTNIFISTLINCSTLLKMRL